MDIAENKEFFSDQPKNSYYMKDWNSLIVIPRM